MLSEKGLLYDREWMIVTEYGSVITQKKEPAMVFIKPFIDLKENLLILRCKGMSSYCKYRISDKISTLFVWLLWRSCSLIVFVFTQLPRKGFNLEL